MKKTISMFKNSSKLILLRKELIRFEKRTETMKFCDSSVKFIRFFRYEKSVFHNVCM